LKEEWAVKKLVLISVLMCFALVAGCHHRSQTSESVRNVDEEKGVEVDNLTKPDNLPKADRSDKNLNISVLMDIGDDNLSQDQIEQREQLNGWMGKDLVRLLNKAGYRANLIENRSLYKSSAYLLKITIVRYNAGSKAARIIVGFGAGAVSLDTRYELFAPSGKLILSDEHGVGSSIEWTSCARKLNKQTLKAVSNKLK
jgi:hypothetical protein